MFNIYSITHKQRVYHIAGLHNYRQVFQITNFLGLLDAPSFSCSKC